MKKLLYIILLLFPLASCDDLFKDFLTEEPETLVTNTNFWKTEKDVESAMNELHSMFREWAGSVTVRLYRDRGLQFDYLGLTWRNISDNELQKDMNINSLTLNWLDEYRTIGLCNFILGNIHRAKIPGERANYYKGQALTLRAYVYFYISRTWGDAVLITSEGDVGEKAVTPWRDIMKVVIDDLLEATRLLPPVNEMKDANGATVTSKQIPSRGTAYAILAHAYAWLAGYGEEPEYYQKGIDAATEVIRSSDYSLVSDPREVCEIVLPGNSREGIFEIDFVDPEAFNRSGNSLAGVTQKWPADPTATPSTRRTLLRLNNESVMAMYPDVHDKRREEYFYKLDSMAQVKTSTTQGAAYIYKFRKPLLHESGSQIGKLRGYDLNEILIRLADIYLLRAEMRAKSNDVPGAITDLNVIRKRAGAKEYTPDENLEEAIALERDKELFLEGICTRYFDIIRNRTFREKLRGKFKTLSDQDVKDGALFFPVSFYAFQNNTKMTQNIYWKRNGFSI